MKPFHLFAAAVLSVSCADFALAQGLVEFIEVHRALADGEFIDFVFVDEFGGVTRQSIGDSDNDDIITAQVPSNTKGKSVHTPACYYVTLENSIVSGLTAGFDQTGNVPLLVDDITGLTVVPAFLVENLSLLQSLSVNDIISVSNGLSSAYSTSATFRMPPVNFPSLTDTNFSDFDSFPLFSGNARVSEVLTVRVYVVPEPSSFGFAAAATALILILARRRRKKVEGGQRAVLA